MSSFLYMVWSRAHVIYLLKIHWICILYLFSNCHFIWAESCLFCLLLEADICRNLISSATGEFRLCCSNGSLPMVSYSCYKSSEATSLYKQEFTMARAGKRVHWAGHWVFRLLLWHVTSIHISVARVTWSHPTLAGSGQCKVPPRIRNINDHLFHWNVLNEICQFEFSIVHLKL